MAYAVETRLSIWYERVFVTFLLLGAIGTTAAALVSGPVSLLAMTGGLLVVAGVFVYKSPSIVRRIEVQGVDVLLVSHSGSVVIHATDISEICKRKALLAGWYIVTTSHEEIKLAFELTGMATVIAELQELAPRIRVTLRRV